MNSNLTEQSPQGLDSRRSFFALCGLLMLAVVQFFVGLGSLPLLGPDEPRYAEVAREMFASGNYVSPFLAGQLWFEKPALLYWLQAGAYHLFGVGEFAARFPSALGALGTVLCVYFALRARFPGDWGCYRHCAGDQCGVVGFRARRDNRHGSVVSISFAILSGYLATFYEGFQARAAPHISAVVCRLNRLAMLAKGLVGILFVVLILGIYWWWHAAP
jgi:hypothetical protein